MPNIQFSLADLSLTAIVIECLLITALIKSVPTPTHRARNLLALLFFTIAIDALCMLLIWHPDLRTLLKPLSSLTISLTTLALLAKGPLLYFFIQSASDTHFRFTRRHCLHLLPIIMGFAIAITYGLSTQKLTTPVEANIENWGTYYWWSLLRASPVAYALLTLYLVRNLHLAFDNHYSGEEYRYARWVRLLIIGFLAQWAMGLGTHIAGQHLPNGMASTLGKISDLAGLILVNVLLAACFTIIRALIPIVSPSATADAATATSTTTALTEPPKSENTEQTDTATKAAPTPNNEQLLALIETLLTQEKVYLNPTLNLEKLSSKTGASTKEVSRAINEGLKASFSELINGYRIDEALRLLELPEHEETPISEIIHLSGFNSKSAFQRFFKRRTDSSPTQYREHITEKRTAI